MAQIGKPERIIEAEPRKEPTQVPAPDPQPAKQPEKVPAEPRRRKEPVPG